MALTGLFCFSKIDTVCLWAAFQCSAYRVIMRWVPCVGCLRWNDFCFLTPHKHRNYLTIICLLPPLYNFVQSVHSFRLISCASGDESQGLQQTRKCSASQWHCSLCRASLTDSALGTGDDCHLHVSNARSCHLFFLMEYACSLVTFISAFLSAILSIGSHMPLQTNT